MRKKASKYRNSAYQKLAPKPIAPARRREDVKLSHCKGDQLSFQVLSTQATEDDMSSQQFPDGLQKVGIEELRSRPPPISSTLAAIPPLESRSLHFFRQKASLKWSGWSDARFWDKLVLQIVNVEASAHHALVSLSAFHEASEMSGSDPRKQKHRKFAFEQNSRALARLTQDYSSVSITAVVSVYFILTAVNTFVQDTTYLEVVRMLSGLSDQLKKPSVRISESESSYFFEYLEPAICRQRSALGLSVDILWSLRNRPQSDFYARRTETPDRFSSLHEARESLLTLLNWTTYQTKEFQLPANQAPKEAKALLDKYFNSLDKFHVSIVVSGRTDCFVSVLKVMAKLGSMLIRCMHANEANELIFDQYTPVFAELADVFRRLITFNIDRSQGEFNILGSVDASLVSIVGQAATRWCRTPSIRRDLIALLSQSKLREGLLGARVFASIAEITLGMEEQGISPPPNTCHDIPAQNRLVIELSGINHATHAQNIMYRHFPFGPNDTTTVWIFHAGCGGYSDNDVELMKTRDKPHLVIGRGYTSWLAPGKQDTYHNIRNPRFYFPIPTF